MANDARFAAKRYAMIVIALLKYEVRSLRLDQFGDWLLRRPRKERLPAPRQLRLLLEHLGGTFVKFGQILAMRPDLLPPEYVTELSSLLDSAPMFDSKVAIAIIESELHHPIEELFQTFNDVPLAAASFAQVHRAVLWNGDQVVVKVQRPGLRKLIDTDLRLMRFLAFLADASGIMRNIRVRPLIGDFIEWTNDELNYVTEATHAELMRKGSDDNRYEYIPKVYWDYTTNKVLVMEYLEGFWISDILKTLDSGNETKLRQLKEAGVDLTIVASNIFDAGLHQVFEEEVFHADPHAGNLVVLRGNRIGYIDFGIVGRLGDRFISTQWQILNAMEQGQLDRLADAALRLFNPPPENTDVDAFREAIKKNARRWMSNFYNPKAPLFERSSASLLTRNMSLARQYGFSYSHVAVRYYRALLVSELIVLQLDRNFNLPQELRTFFTRHGFRSILRDTSPNHLLRDQLRSGRFMRQIPTTMEQTFELVDREVLVLRTSVNEATLFLAKLFKGVVIVHFVLAVMATALRLAAPTTYARLIPIEWRWIFISVVFLAPTFAWTSRKLSIGSVRPGRFVRYR